MTELPKTTLDMEHGTSIRIYSLTDTWSSKKIDELRQNLDRLMSPFGSVEDFAIHLDVPGDDGEPDLQDIRPPDFMSNPKYSINGSVDDEGTMRAHYRYRPIGSSRGRDRDLYEDWESIRESRVPSERSSIDEIKPGCGPFRFEIRAWDLNTDDTSDIAEHYRETRSHIRGAIASQRGVSVYRDEILVLPKSDSTRDWLGLDLRRISRVGPRLSTSQVVGYVRITKADNPGILDTSDREGLVGNYAVDVFRHFVIRVIELLEIERHSDRMDEKETGAASSLFANLSVARLVSDLETLRGRGGDLGDAIKVTKEFGSELDRSRAVIERRFGYYNRLAVIGTIALLVIHEIRSCTTVVGRGLRKARELAEKIQSRSTRGAIELAKTSVNSLESLADRFAPLASRGYSPGRRTSVLEESFNRCRDMQGEEIRAGGVAIEWPIGTRTEVRMDPGEIDAVILNLVTNSLYWMRNHDGPRRLRFGLSAGPSPYRVTVSLDDSGPGILVEDRERVFWPGVTRRPNGIGMGLTVASELIDGRGGKMRTIVPGELGGATFEFDLPLVAKRATEMETSSL